MPEQLTAEAIKTIVSGLVQPLAERLASLEKPAAQATPQIEAKTEPLTMAAITASVSKLLDDRDKTNRAQTELTTNRSTFIESKMKDLPLIYRNSLGNDPAKWDVEEQTIRAGYQTDFKAGGGKTLEVSGDLTQKGDKPGAVVDMSKVSPFEKIKMGLATAKPTMYTEADPTKPAAKA